MYIEPKPNGGEVDRESENGEWRVKVKPDFGFELMQQQNFSPFVLLEMPDLMCILLLSSSHTMLCAVQIDNDNLKS